jgi:hypothetical protein
MSPEYNCAVVAGMESLLTPRSPRPSHRLDQTRVGSNSADAFTSPFADEEISVLIQSDSVRLA